MRSHHPSKIQLFYRNHPPLAHTDGAKVADAAGGDKVCEIADARVSFKSDVWKYFGFLVSRDEKAEKVADRQKKNNTQMLLDYN